MSGKFFKILAYIVIVGAFSTGVIASAETTRKAALKAGMNTDVAKFCFDNNMGRVIEENEFKTLYNYDRELTSAEQLKVLEEVDEYYPWIISRIPLPFIRKDLFNRSYAQYIAGSYLYKSVDELKNILRNEIAPHLPTKWEKYDIPIIAQQEMSDTPEYKRASHPLVLMGVCGSVSVLHTGACMQGLVKIRDYMNPTLNDGALLSARALYEDILSNGKYIEGVRLTALKTLELFETEKVNANSDLYLDLKNSFLTYMKEAEATEATEAAWKVIALLSTGGANTILRLLKIRTAEKFAVLKYALMTISYALPYLDSLMLKYERTYTLPKSVQTTCDFGKPYHFWMTAFLARHLVKKVGISPRAAAVAAYLSQKGYEIASTTTGRDPYLIFQKRSFDSWNNSMRIDIAHSAAGAVYGAAIAQKQEIGLRIDLGVKHLLKDAGVLAPLTREKSIELFQGTGIEAYFRWQKIISPESAFDLYYGKLR